MIESAADFVADLQKDEHIFITDVRIIAILVYVRIFLSKMVPVHASFMDKEAVHEALWRVIRAPCKGITSGRVNRGAVARHTRAKQSHPIRSCQPCHSITVTLSTPRLYGEQAVHRRPCAMPFFHLDGPSPTRFEVPPSLPYLLPGP